MKPFTTIAAVVLGIVALSHLYRVVNAFEVTVAGTDVPQWVSVVAVVVAGGLSIMLWREGKRGS